MLIKWGKAVFKFVFYPSNYPSSGVENPARIVLVAGDMTRPRCDDDVGGEGRLRDASPALHRAWALTLPASVWLCGAVQYGVLVLHTLVKISNNSLTQKLFCSK